MAWRQPLLLLLLPAVLCSTAAVSKFSLHTLRWATTTSLQACVDYPDAVEGYAVLTYSTPDNNLYSVESSEVSSGDGAFCGSFTVEVSTIDFEGEQTYAVNVEEVMTAKRTLALTVDPGSLAAHYLKPVDLVRIYGDGASSATNCVIAHASAQPPVCYVETASQDEICVMLPDEQGDNVTVCDASGGDIPIVEQETAVTSVDLLYANSTIEVNPSSSEPTVLELYLNNDGSTCSDLTCTVTDFTPGPNSIYIITMVEFAGVDQNLPTSSRVTQVQDFAENNTRVSPDTILVKWDAAAAEVDKFDVSVYPDIPGSYSSLQEDCLSEGCQVFFIKLDDNLWQQYRVILQKQGSLSRVIDVLDSYTGFIEDVVQVNTMDHSISGDYSTITTSVCFGWTDPVTDAANTQMALIDQAGAWVQASPVELNRAEPNVSCFQPVQLEALDTDQQIRAMIYLELSNDSRVSGQQNVQIFKPEFEWVSPISARATWQNVKSGVKYYSSDPSDGTESVQIECLSTAVCHYYVNAMEEGGSEFSLVEDINIVQTSNVKLEANVELAELEILENSFRTRYDNRLLVCFTPVPSASRYELGVEHAGTLISSDQDAEIVNDEGQTCAVTSEKVSLGAYVTLWAVVVAYDTSGSTTAAGEDSDEQLYLVSNPSVFVLIDQPSPAISLRVSWQLVDSTEGLQIYIVVLYDETGVEHSVKVVNITESTTTIDVTGEGLYTVCVSVKVADVDLTSEEICSDVVNLKSETEIPDIPEIEHVDLFYTSDNHVKLSWNIEDEDVTEVLVSWDETLPADKRRVRMNFIQDNEYDASLRSGSIYSNELKQSSGFEIVPVSQATVVLPLDNGSWSVCLAAMKENTAGTPDCSSVEVTDAEPVPQPTNPEYFNSNFTLSWEKPEGEVPYTYYLECIQFNTDASTTTYITTDKTSVQMDTLLDPGDWTVTIESILNQRLSEMVYAPNILLAGISFEPNEQTALRTATFHWYGSEELQIYWVVFQSHQYLSGSRVVCDIECTAVFSEVVAKQDEEFILTVGLKDNVLISGQDTFKFKDISDVTQLSSQVHNTSFATVSWTCVLGAKSYNVSMYNANSTLLYNSKETICSHTFNDRMIADDTVSVQACLSTRRCGNTASINLAEVEGGGGGGGDDNNVGIIVGSSIIGGLLLIGIILGVFYTASQRKKKAQLKKEDTISIISGNLSLHSHQAGDSPNNDNFNDNSSPNDQTPQDQPATSAQPVWVPSANEDRHPEPQPQYNHQQQQPFASPISQQDYRPATNPHQDIPQKHNTNPGDFRLPYDPPRQVERPQRQYPARPAPPPRRHRSSAHQEPPQRNHQERNFSSSPDRRQPRQDYELRAAKQAEIIENIPKLPRLNIGPQKPGQPGFGDSKQQPSRYGEERNSRRSYRSPPTGRSHSRGGRQFQQARSPQRRPHSHTPARRDYSPPARKHQSYYSENLI